MERQQADLHFELVLGVERIRAKVFLTKEVRTLELLVAPAAKYYLARITVVHPTSTKARESQQLPLQYGFPPA